jgi:hypothetical protein
MATYKCLIEVRKNGDFIMKADAGTISECLEVAQSTVARKAAEGGTWRKEGDVYYFRYTGETAPRKNPYEKPKKKPKPKYSIAQINKMAREAGMHYGDFVAKMMEDNS